MEGLKGSTGGIGQGQHHEDRSMPGAKVQPADFLYTLLDPRNSIEVPLICTVFKASSISIFIQDRTLRYTWASGPLAGYPADYILSRTDAELFTPDDALMLTEIKRHSLEGCLDMHREADLFANGYNYIFDIFIEPLRNEEGTAEGITCALRDITEQRMRERELMCARSAADAAMHAKAEFLATMSHEIRTPLNAIIGMAGLLQEENLTPDQRDCTDIICRSGEALLAIISNILEISRIEKGCAKLDKAAFDLAACIRGTVGLMELKAKEKGLKLAYDIDDVIPRNLIGDANRLRQILVSLLDNAIKFTDHGEIRVSVNLSSADSERFDVEFSVKDTGIGIPADRMDRLFQSFSQVDMSITRRYGGTGLGLAISKSIVELMGGRIWAKSEEGIGSAFHFTVPFGERSNRGRPTHISLQSKSDIKRRTAEGKSLRILIAEDNSINQKVMLRMLSKLGFKADVAANGFDVLHAMEHQPYDLILMDVQMPDMDGIEATRRIRKLWPKEEPRIIAITAYALDGDRERCIESGMDGYIAKPVKLSELKAALENLFPA